MDDLGTPKTLQEAILRAISIGPLRDTPERIRLAVRDFAAQKFTLIMLQTQDPSELARLENLWALIFGERIDREKK